MEIEKNIPIPPIKTPRTKIYHFENMEIGDSVLFPKGKKVHSLYRSAKKKHGMAFTVRTTEDGVRVWRIS